MPSYACRWPNGDLSFVTAASKQEAIEYLDEVGMAEPCHLDMVRGPLVVHLRLRDDPVDVSAEGYLALDSVSEALDDQLRERWYPAVDAVLEQACASDWSHDAIVAALPAALARERVRVRRRSLCPPAVAAPGRLQPVRAAREGPAPFFSILARRGGFLGTPGRAPSLAKGGGGGVQGGHHLLGHRNRHLHMRHVVLFRALQQRRKRRRRAVGHHKFGLSVKAGTALHR